MTTRFLRILINCFLIRSLLIPVVAILWLGADFTLAAETIKFALIEPLSGPFANIGNNSLRSFSAEFDRINARGGVLGRNFELVALRQQEQSSGDRPAIAGRYRPGHTIRDAGGRLEQRACSERRGRQTQCPQSGPSRAVSELRCARSRLDDGKMPLLAFPVRSARAHDHGGGHRCRRPQSRNQARLSDRSGLRLGSQRRRRCQRDAERQAAGHSDRRRRSPPHREGQGFRAVRGQGESGACRCHRDWELGQRPRSSRQGRQRIGFEDRDLRAPLRACRGRLQ